MKIKTTSALVIIAIALMGISLGLTAYNLAQPGPRGEQGPEGPQGPQGEQGPQGPAALGTGLLLTITDVQIPSDRKPVVAFTLTDGAGTPVRLSDLDTNPRFTIAAIEESGGQTSYVNYVTRTASGKNYTVDGETRTSVNSSTIQVTTDSGGIFTESAAGSYTYAFATVLPEDYDQSATHVVGVYSYKDNRQAVVNDLYTFVPDGSSVTVTRLISTTDTCNSCHNPLEAHGGVRQEFLLCALCHTPQTVDPETGNNVALQVMIHKIHAGEDLPSVQDGTPYYIVGYHESVHNYSDVVFPPSIGGVLNCQTCHTGPDGDTYLTAPSRAACGSCHDDVNFATGVNHMVQTDDSQCSSCHSSTMTSEFDRSIPGAHVIPVYSSQLTGLNFEIISVNDTDPGDSPTVVFTIKEDDGDIIPLVDMDRIVILLAGPTTDYENYWRETATSSTVDNGDGTYSYTLTASIPSDATGSYAIGIEGRKIADIDDGEGGTIEVRDAAFNEVFYFPVTDSIAVPRRTIVSQENCNSCHEDLSVHGDNRKNVQYCSFCHLPSETDEEVRPSGEPVTIHFKYLIHRIHLGEEQTTPYIVYGYRSSINDFSEVRFPGDLKNCAKCHVDDSYELPLSSGVLPTNITYANGTAVDFIQPITASCIACHDSSDVRNHAELMTTSSGDETCIVCHGEGKDFAVSTVHSTDPNSSVLQSSLGSVVILIIAMTAMSRVTKFRKAKPK